MTTVQALRAVARVAISDAYVGDLDYVDEHRIDWITALLPGVTRAQVEETVRSHLLAPPSKREQRRLVGVAKEARRRATEIEEEGPWEWLGGDG